MKILIIQKKFMGDILVSSIVLALLKKKYPKAETTFLIEERYHQILIGNPYLDHIIFWDKKKAINMFLNIRHQKYDIIIDLYSKIDTGLLTLFSQAKRRIGFFKKYTQFFYNAPVKREKQSKSKNTTLGIEHRLQILEPLDIPFEEVFPKTYILESELQNAFNILAENNLNIDDNIVMISTFGSSEEKTYPIEYMAKILDYIAAYRPDIRILCNYLPSQKELFLKLYNIVSLTTQKTIVKDFDTKNLREFAAVTSLCKCLIGNEGGATNLSKSLGIPTFTIFSPQINISDWAWSNNTNLDKFLHISSFVQNSLNYLDFKPSYLESDLKEFLDKTIL